MRILLIYLVLLLKICAMSMDADPKIYAPVPESTSSTSHLMRDVANWAQQCRHLSQATQEHGRAIDGVIARAVQEIREFGDPDSLIEMEKLFVRERGHLQDIVSKRDAGKFNKTRKGRKEPIDALDLRELPAALDEAQAMLDRLAGLLRKSKQDYQSTLRQLQTADIKDQGTDPNKRMNGTTAQLDTLREKAGTQLQTYRTYIEKWRTQTEKVKKLSTDYERLFVANETARVTAVMQTLQRCASLPSNKSFSKKDRCFDQTDPVCIIGDKMTEKVPTVQHQLEDFDTKSRGRTESRTGIGSVPSDEGPRSGEPTQSEDMDRGHNVTWTGLGSVPLNGGPRLGGPTQSEDMGRGHTVTWTGLGSVPLDGGPRSGGPTLREDMDRGHTATWTGLGSVSKDDGPKTSEKSKKGRKSKTGGKAAARMEAYERLKQMKLLWVVTRAYKAKEDIQLTLKVGDYVRQLLPEDRDGISYGALVNKKTGKKKKKKGFYPADHLVRVSKDDLDRKFGILLKPENAKDKQPEFMQSAQCINKLVTVREKGATVNAIADDHKNEESKKTNTWSCFGKRISIKKENIEQKKRTVAQNQDEDKGIDNNNVTDKKYKSASGVWQSFRSQMQKLFGIRRDKNSKN